MASVEIIVLLIAPVVVMIQVDSNVKVHHVPITNVQELFPQAALFVPINHRPLITVLHTHLLLPAIPVAIAPAKPLVQEAACLLTITPLAARQTVLADIADLIKMVAV